jgi:hypothetical protein
MPPPACCLPQTSGSSKVVHSASLPMSKAIWEYSSEARWTIFLAAMFFFLSAQASRQVGLPAACCLLPAACCLLPSGRQCV